MKKLTKEEKLQKKIERAQERFRRKITRPYVSDLDKIIIIFAIISLIELIIMGICGCFE